MTNKELIESAREVIDRLGSEAIAYMERRIDALERDGERRDVDQAYRLLSEVERQLQPARR